MQIPYLQTNIRTTFGMGVHIRKEDAGESPAYFYCLKSGKGFWASGNDAQLIRSAEERVHQAKVAHNGGAQEFQRRKATGTVKRLPDTDPAINRLRSTKDRLVATVMA